MIETISIIITLLAGFGATVALHYQVLQETRKNTEATQSNKLEIVKLRGDMEREFSSCREHHKNTMCAGLQTDKNTT